ncbi:MAG: KUP/HAK/KT family potassium transporter [Bacteroidota bacterium]|jgi:KUP system potassium uptake protein|nr:KUP/HAK/KT family potassium transporter [Bacteroidota bacterium]MCA6442685.1 KUP/HAK/KT family potassium transporter [Bacteroidota bacterium]
MGNHQHGSLNKITFGGLLVTLGIIYGDIGTSPLYVLKAIVGDGPINPDLVKGAISAIFWTLTLQTTIKYVVLTLRADNKGEGGIFSLYTLVKRSKYKWLIVPAIIGGSALLADGIITPPISVSSAIEGLKKNYPTLNTVPYVIAIITALFFIQRFGTKFIGRAFGPIMFIWFTMLGILGISKMVCNLSIFSALNPYYTYKLLQTHPSGMLILGAVFLCTTGAEALYSDLGHCGKKNIRVSWFYVKTMLVLNYFGQGAWLISNEGKSLNGANPFYEIMPHWFIIPGIIIATSAAVIASQALISGSFTLINEAMRLNLWPKVRVKYPSDEKGQLYIPSLNTMLLLGCIGVVLYFRESGAMEAAYGLAIVLCMMMTTVLLNFYMHIKRYNYIFIVTIITIYAIIELSFFYANMDKFTHGGWITLVIAGTLMLVMTVWFLAKKIRMKYTDVVALNDYKQFLIDLSRDESIPKYATHLVYLTSVNDTKLIEQKIIHSILQRRPKRADIYWFVHVDVMDEPYRMEYKVDHIAEDDIIRVDFKLGFRVAPKINLMFRKVVEDLVENKEVDIRSRYESLQKNNISGDFKFVVVEKYLSYDNDMPFFRKVILEIYYFLKHLSLSEAKAFGLDSSSVKVERFPMIFKVPESIKNLKRISTK